MAGQLTIAFRPGDLSVNDLTSGAVNSVRVQGFFAGIHSVFGKGLKSDNHEKFSSKRARGPLPTTVHQITQAQRERERELKEKVVTLKLK